MDTLHADVKQFVYTLYADFVLVADPPTLAASLVHYSCYFFYFFYILLFHSYDLGSIILWVIDIIITISTIIFMIIIIVLLF